MDSLELAWLGPPQVRVNGTPVRLETRKTTALLALLSLERRPLAREYLAALFWPEFDATRAEASLFFGDDGQFGAFDANDLVLVSVRYSY